MFNAWSKKQYYCNYSIQLCWCVCVCVQTPISLPFYLYHSVSAIRKRDSEEHSDYDKNFVHHEAISVAF